jgi:hypothetical protein
LTFETDKLPAIAGVAAKLQSLLKYKYLAGLWQEDLFHGLLWRCDIYPEAYSRVSLDSTTVEASTSYIAPPWSWASTNKPVKWRRRLMTTLATLRSSNIKYLEGNDLGIVGSRTSINLSGHFIIPRSQVGLYLDNQSRNTPKHLVFVIGLNEWRLNFEVGCTGLVLC